MNTEETPSRYTSVERNADRDPTDTEECYVIDCGRPGAWHLMTDTHSTVVCVYHLGPAVADLWRVDTGHGDIVEISVQNPPPGRAALADEGPGA